MVREKLREREREREREMKYLYHAITYELYKTQIYIKTVKFISLLKQHDVCNYVYM